MKRLHFSIKIEASKERVWAILWNDSSYKEWTRAFNENASVQTDWNEGSKVLFVNNEGDGMYSKIERKVPHEQMTFVHIGPVKKGEEQPHTVESRKWSGSKEQYELKDKEDGTELSVDFDVPDDQLQYFKEIFPKALKSVKSLSES